MSIEENSPDIKKNQDLLKGISANDINTGNISQENKIESIALGTKYPVRMRSLERLNLDYLDFNYNQ